MTNFNINNLFEMFKVKTDLEKQIELELEQEEQLTHYRENQALDTQRANAWNSFNNNKNKNR